MFSKNRPRESTHGTELKKGLIEETHKKDLEKVLIKQTKIIINSQNRPTEVNHRRDLESRHGE